MRVGSGIVQSAKWGIFSLRIILVSRVIAGSQRASTSTRLNTATHTQEAARLDSHETLIANNSSEVNDMQCANCTWTKANHTHSIAASLTCGDFTPLVRNAAPVVADPDRCVNCDEPFTPRVTKGATKCKCDVPRPPRWVMEQAERAPLVGSVRYGGRS